MALHNVVFTGADVLLWGNDYRHDEGTWPDSRPRIDAIRTLIAMARVNSAFVRPMKLRTLAMPSPPVQSVRSRLSPLVHL